MNEDEFKHAFPKDKELDNIKQLLDSRTIHLQLGVDPDNPSRKGLEVVQEITDRMKAIFGEHAVKAASAAAMGTPPSVAYHSMYDTAMMRIWWEKFGGTVDVRRSTDTSEAGGRLERSDPPDADEAAQPHEGGAEQ